MRHDSCVPVLGILHHADENEFPILNFYRFALIGRVRARKSISLYYRLPAALHYFATDIEAEAESSSDQEQERCVLFKCRSACFSDVRERVQARAGKRKLRVAKMPLR
jgi:hypothetical protein